MLADRAGGVATASAGSPDAPKAAGASFLAFTHRLSACSMSELHQCKRCSLRLVELDAYGERLRGCLGCNRWQAVTTGEWRQLPEDDIAALRGTGTRACTHKSSPGVPGAEMSLSGVKQT